ncbi:MAG: DUF3786 domain-containing protein [Actinomycetota bacterium]|nr:DUF3786 domain-containing protein [Actinomycetota bacterium]
MPENKTNNQDVIVEVYNKYIDQLNAMDLEAVCLNSGSVMVDKDHIEVKFFNDRYIVDVANRNIKDKQNNNVDPYRSSIILHYLVVADGTPVSGKWISFRQLPHGLFYAKTVEEAMVSVAEKYGSNADLFMEKVQGIGGRRSSEFEYGVIVNGFSRVSLLMVLYPESEEFGSEARVFYDQSISHYLKTDIVKLVTIHCLKLLLK